MPGNCHYARLHFRKRDSAMTWACIFHPKTWAIDITNKLSETKIQQLKAMIICTSKHLKFSVWAEITFNCLLPRCRRVLESYLWPRSGEGLSSQGLDDVLFLRPASRDWNLRAADESAIGVAPTQTPSEPTFPLWPLTYTQLDKFVFPFRE